MLASTNMPNNKDSQLIFRLTEKVVSGIRRGRPNVKRTVWEAEYLDGSKVDMIFLDGRILMNGGVDFVQWPHYCGTCLKPTDHDFYHYNQSIKCRCCGSNMGENDTRPEAKVLSFPERMHSAE